VYEFLARSHALITTRSNNSPRSDHRNNSIQSNFCLLTFRVNNQAANYKKAQHTNINSTSLGIHNVYENYKVVQIWPGLMRLVYTQISPGHIWTTFYYYYYYYYYYFCPVISFLLFSNVLHKCSFLRIKDNFHTRIKQRWNISCVTRTAFREETGDTEHSELNGRNYFHNLMC